MIDQIIVIYCIADEVSKCMNVQDDPQCKMTQTEIMTFAVISASMFRCDYKRTRLISKHLNLFKKILSLSQLVRRIHRVPEHAWTLIFTAFNLYLRNKDNKIFIVDSFPVKAYENHKSFRARIFSDKKFHGYTATKKQFFFGLKVHMVVDIDGVPIEFSFTPGSVSDIKALRDMTLDLPQDSMLLADKAYTDYLYESQLIEIEKIELLPKRKSNHKKQWPQEKKFILQMCRNRIESVFSSITSRMPNHIKARTEKGFCLKMMFFILAYLVNLYCPLIS